LTLINFNDDINAQAEHKTREQAKVMSRPLLVNIYTETAEGSGLAKKYMKTSVELHREKTIGVGKPVYLFFTRNYSSMNLNR